MLQDSKCICTLHLHEDKAWPCFNETYVCFLIFKNQLSSYLNSSINSSTRNDQMFSHFSVFVLQFIAGFGASLFQRVARSSLSGLHGRWTMRDESRQRFAIRSVQNISQSLSSPCSLALSDPERERVSIAKGDKNLLAHLCLRYYF